MFFIYDMIISLLFTINSFRLFIAIKTSYIKPFSRHYPRMHISVLAQVMGKVTRGVKAATVVHAVLNQRQVFLTVYVERGNGPVGYRLLGLLLHLQHFHVFIYGNHSRPLQLLQFGFVMAHYH